MKIKIKRHFRLFFSKIKKKPYIKLFGRKVYITKKNKNFLLNGYKYVNKKKPKKNIKKLINEYVKKSLETQIKDRERLIKMSNTIPNINSKMMFSSGTIDQQQGVNDDRRLRMDDPLFNQQYIIRTVQMRQIPQIEYQQPQYIQYMPYGHQYEQQKYIPFHDGSKLAYYNTDSLKQEIPNIWSEKQKEFEYKNMQSQNYFNKVNEDRILQEKMLKKNLKKQKKDFTIQDKKNELNFLGSSIIQNQQLLSKDINQNINEFKDEFLHSFFDIKKKQNYKTEIKQNKEKFFKLQPNEQINMYESQLKKLGRTQKFQKGDLKNKSKNLVPISQINEKKIYLDELQNKYNKLNEEMSKYEQMLTDEYTDNKYTKSEEEKYFGEIEEDNKDNLINIYKKSERQNQYYDGYTSGDGIVRGGLFNFEIDKIMSPFKNYIGTFTLNQVNEIIKIIKDNNLKTFSFIINTLTNKNKNVGHWIAIYVDFINNLSVEIYDPLAKERKDMYNLIYDKIKNLIDYFEIPNYLKLKINKIRQQSVTSSNCGWFCIRFLLMRYQNISFKIATGYKGIKENELNVNNLKKSYLKFGYI